MNDTDTTQLTNSMAETGAGYPAVTTDGLTVQIVSKRVNIDETILTDSDGNEYAQEDAAIRPLDEPAAPLATEEADEADPGDAAKESAEADAGETGEETEQQA